MATTYPPYPDYRDSGIEWLGNIPDHWQIISAKICYEIQLGKMLQNDAENITDREVNYLKALHVTWSGIKTDDLPKMWASTNDLEKYVVNDGDLLICEGGEVGRASILKKSNDDTWIIQNAVHRVRNSELADVEYFNYLLRHIADSGWFEILCNKATIAHLTGEKLGALTVSTPSIPEQQTIALFLDHKTWQIDQIIAKKQALIGKLTEQRIALITHAVTKGLNPAVTLKDSGVEWLGNVPEHWDSVRLRYITEKITSGSRGWAQYFSDDGEQFLRITNLSRKSISLLEDDMRRVNPPEGTEGERTKTQTGDILVSITADLGSIAVIPENYEASYVSQHIALVRPEPEQFNSKWIAYCLFSHAGKAQLLGAGYGGTKIQLNLSDVKEVYVSSVHDNFPSHRISRAR